MNRCVTVSTWLYRYKQVKYNVMYSQNNKYKSDWLLSMFTAFFDQQLADLLPWNFPVNLPNLQLIIYKFSSDSKISCCCFIRILLATATFFFAWKKTRLIPNRSCIQTWRTTAVSISEHYQILGFFSHLVIFASRPASSVFPFVLLVMILLELGLPALESPAIRDT